MGSAFVPPTAETKKKRERRKCDLLRLKKEKSKSENKKVGILTVGVAFELCLHALLDGSQASVISVLEVQLAPAWHFLGDVSPVIDALTNESDELHVLLDCPGFLVDGLVQVSQVALLDHLLAVVLGVGELGVENPHLLVPLDPTVLTKSLDFPFQFAWPFGFVVSESYESPFAGLWVRIGNTLGNLRPSETLLFEGKQHFVVFGTPNLFEVFDAHFAQFLFEERKELFRFLPLGIAFTLLLRSHWQITKSLEGLGTAEETVVE